MLKPRLSLLLAISTLVLGACGGGATPSRPGHRAARLHTMFEAQSQLLSDPVGTVTLLRRLGADEIRVFVPWASLAPDAAATRPPVGVDLSSPAAYPEFAWAPYDGVVRAAAAQGMTVDLTLEGPAPRWATGAGQPHGGPFGQWRPAAPRYGAFVHAIAARYSGGYRPPGAAAALPRVAMWSIWNEPNYGTQLAPQAVQSSTIEVAPALYRGLVDAAWRSLQSTGHAHDTILIGELAPRGLTTGNNPGDFAGMVPLRFLRALYCVDGSMHPLVAHAATARGCPASGSGADFRFAHPGLFEASGYALHLYPQGSVPPNVSTPGEPDYADLATVGRFEGTLDRIAGVYGSSRRFPVYDTEFGYKTNPPFVAGAPLATAAAYLNWGEYLHWRDPRIRSYDQYLLTDPSGRSNFATGLEFADGRPKPLLAAFRVAIYLPRTQASAGTGLEVWGCVRPARSSAGGAGSAARVSVQFAPAGGGPYRDLKRVGLDDPDGYFDLSVAIPRSGSVRLAWRDPHGPVLYSRTVPVSIG